MTCLTASYHLPWFLCPLLVWIFKVGYSLSTRLNAQRKSKRKMDYLMATKQWTESQQIWSFSSSAPCCFTLCGKAPCQMERHILCQSHLLADHLRSSGESLSSRTMGSTPCGRSTALLGLSMLFWLRKVNRDDWVCIPLQRGHTHVLPALRRSFTPTLCLYFYQNARKYEILALWTAFASYVSHHFSLWPSFPTETAEVSRSDAFPRSKQIPL